MRGFINLILFKNSCHCEEPRSGDVAILSLTMGIKRFPRSNILPSCGAQNRRTRHSPLPILTAAPSLARCIRHRRCSQALLQTLSPLSKGDKAAVLSRVLSDFDEGRLTGKVRSETAFAFCKTRRQKAAKPPVLPHQEPPSEREVDFCRRQKDERSPATNFGIR